VVVAAQNATTHASYMDKYFKDHAELKLYDTLDNETADLKAGRVDLVMAGGIQISDWLKSTDGADYEIKVKLPNDQLFGYGDGAGLRKEDNELRQKLNRAIAAVRASGEYQKITAKYFDFDIYE
jgi:polar amino acid transport system substrate-binding protein